MAVADPLDIDVLTDGAARKDLLRTAPAALEAGALPSRTDPEPIGRPTDGRAHARA
jgi:hypothetical protein